jgi:radical SAM-linked protein
VKRRIRYTKLGKVRFLGHRDLARCWERAVRKAGLGVEYSQGFSPRPKMHFGLALNNGAESIAEYVDIDFVEDHAPSELCQVLSAALPIGVECTGAASVPAGSPSLQEQVDSCVWRIGLFDVDAGEVERNVANAIAADQLHLEVQRKGKSITVDLRPQLWMLTTTSSPGASAALHMPAYAQEMIAPEADATRPQVELLAELGTKPRGVRPDELLRVLAPNLGATRVLRLAQLTTTEAGRVEPIAVPDFGTVDERDPATLQTPEASAR